MLFCDLYRYVPCGSGARGVVRLLNYIGTMLIHPGWHAVFNYRLAQIFYRLKLLPVSWLLYRCNMFVFSIDIHPGVKSGPGLWMPHPIGIVIARDAELGCECTVYQNVTIGGRGNPPSIGSRVVLGAGSCVIGEVMIGDCVIVGANAAVVKSVPADTTVGGVPARAIVPAA